MIHERARSTTLPFLLLAMLAVLMVPALALAQNPPDDEIARLKARIAQLEAELAEARRPHLYAEEELATEESVKPGINDSWRSDDIGPLIGRLETESREIFTERFNLAAVVGVPKGAVIADIGAGSGFMTNVFARQVGPGGKVYAVDINPVMLRHVHEGAKDAGLENIEIVVCTDKSTELPPASIDMAFICDTYHHFEFPKNTMTSLRQALKPGGQVVVVDFHRIEGETAEWLMEHVRAGEEVFTQEILDAGFELVNDHDVDFLTENYVLRFRKVGS